MRLTLLGRRGCGLCEDAARLLSETGLDFESVDIDSDPALVAAFSEAIPVLLAGGREVCRAPISPESLRASLRIAGMAIGG